MYEEEAAEKGRAEGFDQLGLVISGVTSQAPWSNMDNTEPTVSPQRGRGRPRGRGRGRGRPPGSGRGPARRRGGATGVSRGSRGSRWGGRGRRGNRSLRGNRGKGREQSKVSSPGHRRDNESYNPKPNQSYQYYLTDYPLLRMVKKAPTASDCFSLNADFAMIDPSSMDQRQTMTITRFGIQIRRPEPSRSGSRFTCELCKIAMGEVQELRHHLDERQHTQNKYKAIAEGLPIYNKQKIAITYRRKHGISTPGIIERGNDVVKTELEADDEADGTIHCPDKSPRHSFKQSSVSLQHCAEHLEVSIKVMDGILEVLFISDYIVNLPVSLLYVSLLYYNMSKLNIYMCCPR